MFTQMMMKMMISFNYITNMSTKGTITQLRSLIIQYFQCISSGQNVSQCIRQALFLHKKFNPLLLFDIVSQDKRIYTRKDLSVYLINNSIGYNQEQFACLWDHHQFAEQVRFTQFMEAIIPYNADVLRIFKRDYLELIEIQALDAEVQAIFLQLLKFELKFFGNLSKIKRQIASISDQHEVEDLIKQDLVIQNKNRSNVRQSVKFKQMFQLPEFQFTFNQLRRFLELWQVPEQKNIQFDLLQIKRHLRVNNPFIGIINKNQSNSNNKKHSPIKNRSKSVQRISKKKPIDYSSNTKRDSQNNYQNFKSQLFNELKGNKFTTSPKPVISNNQMYYMDSERPSSGLPSGAKGSNKKHKQVEARKLDFNDNQQQQKEQNIRNNRYLRDKKCIDGTLIVKILQQICTKQQELQQYRKKLASNHDFNLINLFKLIDANNKGYVSSKMIQQYIGVDVRFKHLVDYYARENGKLRFQDFCMIFRPLSKKLNQVLDEKPQNRLPNPFKKQSIHLISKILTLSAEMFSEIYSIREQINNSGITPQNLFSYVDLKNKGYISSEDIKDLLEEKGIACDAKNLKCIMKIFGFRVDGKISLQQFERFIDL